MPPSLCARIALPAETGGSDASLFGRELRGIDELRAAAALYAHVFQYESADFALNLNLLSALTQNGGSAVGVFTEQEELVGFAYGFAGCDVGGQEFHYSQAATVDPRFQGRGVGRTLKHLQAQVAARWGHRSMRWTFDPLLAKNAHFNFSSLGASGIAYRTDYYERPGTDRILVEWNLDAERRLLDRGARAFRTPPLLDRSDWAIPRTDDDAVWVALPATPPTGAEAAELRPRLAEALSEALSEGRQLIACPRISDTTSAYLAVPDRPKETR